MRGELVGHILFSPISIETNETSTPALALAPMSVLPACQKRGTGSLLVEAGLRACRRLGHGIVVVLGHSSYYPRFGFAPAVGNGAQAPFPVPDNALMVLELVPGALRGVTGTLKYPSEFDDA